MNIAAVMVQSLVFVSRHGHVLFFLNGEFVHFFGRHFFPTTIPAALPVVFKAEKRFGCVFCFLFFEKELLLTVWFCSNATAGFGWVGGATLKKKTNRRKSRGNTQIHSGLKKMEKLKKWSQLAIHVYKIQGG